MKKRSLLFTVLCMMCVALVAGCGEVTFEIKTSSSDTEAGTISGGGRYEVNSTATLRITPNLGCDLKSVELKGTGTEWEGWPSNTPTHSLEISVNDVTKGEYVANFECGTNSASNVINTNVLQHKITYTVEGVETSGVTTEWDEQIADGSTISEVNYRTGISGKIVWYTQSVVNLSDEARESLKYDFKKPVTSGFTLYGIVAPQTTSEIITEAIQSFAKSSKLRVSIGNEVANILNLDKGLTAMELKVVESGNNKFLIKDNVYYEYTDSNVAGLKLLKDGETGFGFKVSDIKDVFKFVEIKDLDITGYDIIKSTETKMVTTVEEIECEIYELKSEETVKYELYIYNGQIYGYKKDGVEVTIEQVEGDLAGSIPSSPKEMYLIQLHPTGEAAFVEEDSGEGEDKKPTISETIDTINNDFSKVLKIVPSFGQTVENVIKNHPSLADITQNYAYTLTKYGTVACTFDTYDNNSVVNSNTSVCLYFAASKTPVQTAIKNLENGGYTITIGSKVLEQFGLSGVTYPVGEGVNILELAQKPEEMNNKMYECIEKMKMLIATDPLNKFTIAYDSEKKIYSFDFTEDGTRLAIKLEGNAEENVFAVDYFDGSNTYELTFPLIQETQSQ